ncbi:MAG: MarR family transcriptional regulator [Bacteroidales bacterium]|nr:MarR family transcriptional regulator [Bacteroidales bacterium]
MEFEQLKLDNQLCFPVYAASRLITREYQPYLDRLGITYPQYLVMLVLWEHGGITVNEIARKLILQTNTVTPLLKRMESMGLVTRVRSGNDERKVLISLTENGRNMQAEAAKIPEELAKGLISGPMELQEIISLKTSLERLIGYLSAK